MRRDQLKRRLVGALVLVSLAVIFLPMLMDRRAVEENLGAAIPSRDTGPFNEQLAKAKPAPPAAPSAPAPAAPVTAAAPAVDPNTLPATAAGNAGVSPPPAVAQPALRAWVVQVGSFSQRDNAEGVAKRLRAAGFDTVIETASVAGQLVYRVQVGPEASEDRAELVRQRIQDTVKLQGSVQPHPAG